MTDATLDTDLGPDRDDSRDPVAAESRAFSGGDCDSVLVESIETAQAVAEEGWRWVEEKQLEARSFIQENPLSSAGLLFGGGVLLGMLLNRK